VNGVDISKDGKWILSCSDVSAMR